MLVFDEAGTVFEKIGLSGEGLAVNGELGNLP